MKIHFSRCLPVLLVALCMSAHAEYIWVGAVDPGTSKKIDGTTVRGNWAIKENWECTNGDEWVDGVDGPGYQGDTTNGMWGAIIIRNTTTQPDLDGFSTFNRANVAALQGHQLRLTLENASFSVGTIRQFSGNCELNIDENSCLRITGPQVATADDSSVIVNCDGTFRMSLSNNTGNFIFNLGETGYAKIDGEKTNLTLGLTKLTFSLPDPVYTLPNTAFEPTTRQLVTLWEGQTATPSLSIASDAITLDEESLLHYVQVFSEDEVVEGTYFIKNNEEGIAVVYGARLADAIPEPTTATLSLLALAGLAARRRRK